ncbi:DMT family transporter [Haloarcula sp. CGMCC 1.6347]|uniref:DMT family transporter n=1 Tax=Haloarcula sp. CGMCC 1.6347 TaxID=3111455 RepID=UPI00300F113A
MMSRLDRTIGVLAPLLAAVLWGGMYVVSKWGFGAIPPVTLGFLRVAIGAVLLVAVVKSTVATRSPTRADWRGFVGLGALVTATIVTQFVGTNLTTASQGSLLTVATPVAALLLAAVVVDERLTRAKAIGVGLAIAGTVLVVVDSGLDGTLDPAGVLALLGAGVAWAAYTVWGKPLVARFSALETATYATVTATPMLAVLSAGELWLLGRPISSLPTDPAVLGAVAYLGVFATAAAWYLWYKGLEYVDAGTVSVLFVAQPLVGTALGAALLGERVGPWFLVGGSLLLAAVVVVGRARA